MLVMELRVQGKQGRGAEEGYHAAFCHVAEGLPGETGEFCGACWASLPELKGLLHWAGLVEVLLNRQCLSLKMILVSEPHGRDIGVAYHHVFQARSARLSATIRLACA
jgi:hypothetical protein